jgi:quercetin dioxygenase-like cupin family protein
MTHPPSQAATPIPADDPTRSFTLVCSDNPSLPHIGLVGDTYTILVAGKDTAGRYSLIDMHIPPGGGPPPHRHDFEEMFSVLEGEIETTFRGKKTIIRAGDTINIPANAPHQFQNKSAQPVPLLCLCSPAGQEEFFKEVGVCRRDADNTATPTRRGGRGSIRGKSQSSSTEIPNRAFAPLKEERARSPGRRPSAERHQVACPPWVIHDRCFQYPFLSMSVVTPIETLSAQRSVAKGHEETHAPQQLNGPEAASRRLCENSDVYSHVEIPSQILRFEKQ